jgi:hypothetical protein
MKKTLLAILTISLVLISGCKPGPYDVSRFPSIAIPEYTMTDYFKLLYNENPEIVYNAVCNLQDEAFSVAAAISGPDVDKTSREYIVSLAVYKRIRQLLESNDARIVSSSLRFLEYFSGNYEKKEELIGPVLRIKSDNPMVQFEQVTMLSLVASKDAKIDNPTLKRFINSKSWLVSRGAYALVNKLEREGFRMEVIKRYRSMGNEAERLLMLTALETNFSRETFQFLASELLSEKDQKIRHKIFAMLGGAREKRAVLEWIERNYERFSKEDIEALADIYAETEVPLNDFSSGIFLILVKKGYAPNEGFFKKLEDSITQYNKKKELTGEEREALERLLQIKQRAPRAPAVPPEKGKEPPPKGGEEGKGKNAAAVTTKPAGK